VRKEDRESVLLIICCVRYTGRKQICIQGNEWEDSNQITMDEYISVAFFEHMFDKVLRPLRRRANSFFIEDKLV
jgi:hypothetical protein